MLWKFRVLFLAWMLHNRENRNRVQYKQKNDTGVEKGHTAARKVTNVLGLAKQVNTASSAANHTFNLEKTAIQMMNECKVQ